MNLKTPILGFFCYFLDPILDFNFIEIKLNLGNIDLPCSFLEKNKVKIKQAKQCNSLGSRGLLRYVQIGIQETIMAGVHYRRKKSMVYQNQVL